MSTMSSAWSSNCTFKCCRADEGHHWQCQCPGCEADNKSGTCWCQDGGEKTAHCQIVKMSGHYRYLQGQMFCKACFVHREQQKAKFPHIPTPPPPPPPPRRPNQDAPARNGAGPVFGALANRFEDIENRMQEQVDQNRAIMEGMRQILDRFTALIPQQPPPGLLLVNVTNEPNDEEFIANEFMPNDAAGTTTTNAETSSGEFEKLEPPGTFLDAMKI